MNARVLALLAAASFSALTIGGCGAEPAEEIGTQQEAIGVRPVNELGQPLNPVTLQPMDDYPIGYCTHVCSLSKRWVAMTNNCKPGASCDDLANQECTQEWTKPVFGENVCAREVKRSCLRPLPP